MVQWIVEWRGWRDRETERMRGRELVNVWFYQVHRKEGKEMKKKKVLSQKQRGKRCCWWLKLSQLVMTRLFFPVAKINWRWQCLCVYLMVAVTRLVAVVVVVAFCWDWDSFACVCLDIWFTSLDIHTHKSRRNSSSGCGCSCSCSWCCSDKGIIEKRSEEEAMDEKGHSVGKEKSCRWLEWCLQCCWWWLTCANLRPWCCEWCVSRFFLA